MPRVFGLCPIVVLIEHGACEFQFFEVLIRPTGSLQCLVSLHRYVPAMGRFPPVAVTGSGIGFQEDYMHSRYLVGCKMQSAPDSSVIDMIESSLAVDVAEVLELGHRLVWCVDKERIAAVGPVVHTCVTADVDLLVVAEP